MFSNFPKEQPSLPKEIEDIYLSNNLATPDGRVKSNVLNDKIAAWMHRQVAGDVMQRQYSATVTLELGAGSLKQLRYEPIVHSYDIVEPHSELCKDSPLLGRVRNIYTDISEIPQSSRYNRITSVETLEKMCNLPEVIARSGLLMAEGGVFRASVPSKGTLLWKLGWRLTTGLELKLKHGLDYELIMEHEQVNTAREIEEVLGHFFREVNCRVFGLSKSISIYQYYECYHPRTDRCRELLEEGTTN